MALWKFAGIKPFARVVSSHNAPFTFARHQEKPFEQTPTTSRGLPGMPMRSGVR